MKFPRARFDDRTSGEGRGEKREGCSRVLNSETFSQHPTSSKPQKRDIAF